MTGGGTAVDMARPLSRVARNDFVVVAKIVLASRVGGDEYSVRKSYPILLPLVSSIYLHIHAIVNARNHLPISTLSSHTLVSIGSQYTSFSVGHGRARRRDGSVRGRSTASRDSEQEAKHGQCADT